MVKTAFVEEILEIPEGVTVNVEGNNQITVKGPKGGPVTKDFSHARGIRISIEGKKIKFSAHFPKNKTQALIGTITSIIKNLIQGVQANFKYICKVCYSHFPCNVEVKKKTINDFNIKQMIFAKQAAKSIEKYINHHFNELTYLSGIIDISSFNENGKTLLKKFYYNR